MHKNVLIDALLTQQPDAAVFLVEPNGTEITYGTLRAEVAGTMAALAQAGVAPGDRVLCQMAKSTSGLILYLATVAAGAIFVPLNPAYRGAEIDYFLEDAAPALLILDDSTWAAAPLADARAIPVARPETLITRGGPLSPVSREADDLAAILYTSGTTGRSKGAMLSHDNLLSNALCLRDLWRFEASDRLLHALPIFHTHGLFVATNVALAAGAAMIFLPKFDLDQVAQVLPQATSMMGVPTFYTRMLGDQRFNHGSMAQMRLVISGSAPLLAETHQEFEAQTGLAILERYGMTETNMITSNPYDSDRRPGTVGHPLPGVEMRIAEPDDAGIGGVEVRGPNVTKGYWQNAEKTAESYTEDGWFITGDLGVVDADGYLSIVGREKDLIISGGYNIYPKEVEQALDALPGVVESAVYGVPDGDLGEVVGAALVTAEDGPADATPILAALEDQLARFKHPRHVVFLPELPRNAMGKVQKSELRKRALQQ